MLLSSCKSCLDVEIFGTKSNVFILVFLVGYEVYLHRYFILEAKEQGIPATKIYCSRESNRNSVYSKRRFDWITVLDPDTSERVVCQLSGLWELRRKESEHRQKKSVFYFSCIPTEKVRTRNVNKLEAFSKIRYHLYRKHRDLRFITLFKV